MARVPQVRDEGARLSPPDESPPDARVSIRETLDGLGIHNPARRSIARVLFLWLWLAGWAAGEVFALSELTRGGNIAGALFLLVWLVIWTIGGLGVLTIVLWNLFGAERLFVTGGALVRSVGFGPFQRRRVYALDEVGDFRVLGKGGSGAFPVGMIRFRVRGQDRTLGLDMSRDEAEAVLAAIRRALPEETPPAAEEA